MDEFFRQVARASDSHLYFLALSGALVIPDMCAALEDPDGVTTGPQYQDWFDRNLTPRYAFIPGEPPFMDGRTCWQFRCALLHQGRTEHPKSRYARVVFIEPGASTNVAHMNVLNDALNIDVHQFCMEMVESALTWRESVLGTEPYETNIRRFVTRHPNGLPPYMGGVPVIS